MAEEWSGPTGFMWRRLVQYEFSRVDVPRGVFGHAQEVGQTEQSESV